MNAKPKVTALQALVEVEQKQQLESIAARMRVSQSELVRQALALWLTQRAKGKDA